MKSALILVALALLSTSSFPEEVHLRQEAVRLLEKANEISTAPHLPNLERVDNFRVFGSGSGIQEGTFTRVVLQGTGRRDETKFGDYHVIDVWTRDRLATVRTNEMAPPEVKDLMRLTPILLVSFDHEDVIHAIVNREVSGRAARCIEFDTVTGQQIVNNELCVDAANGALLLERLADELIENGDFFPFVGALMPGKISYSYRGVLKMEISQTMTVLEDATANVLAAPPNAQIRTMCATFRRPFGESMPQPAPGSGGERADVIVRGIIGVDGRVHDAVVQISERPDLNGEALSLIQRWVFTPAMCDGKPNANEASFTLHFQGR